MIRQPTEEDLERFKVCLEADPDHKGQDPEDWTGPGGEFMVVYDERGNRLFLRIERALRVSIQHDPQYSRLGTSRILYKAFHWLLSQSRQSGFSEVVFESRAPRLIQFLTKLFGVKPVEDYRVRTV